MGGHAVLFNSGEDVEEKLKIANLVMSIAAKLFVVIVMIFILAVMIGFVDMGTVYCRHDECGKGPKIKATIEKFPGHAPCEICEKEVKV